MSATGASAGTDDPRPVDPPDDARLTLEAFMDRHGIAGWIGPEGESILRWRCVHVRPLRTRRAADLARALAGAWKATRDVETIDPDGVVAYGRQGRCDMVVTTGDRLWTGIAEDVAAGLVDAVAHGRGTVSLNFADVAVGVRQLRRGRRAGRHVLVHLVRSERVEGPFTEEALYRASRNPPLPLDMTRDRDATFAEGRTEAEFVGLVSDVLATSVDRDRGFAEMVMARSLDPEPMERGGKPEWREADRVTTHRPYALCERDGALLDAIVGVFAPTGWSVTTDAKRNRVFPLRVRDVVVEPWDWVFDGDRRDGAGSAILRHLRAKADEAEVEAGRTRLRSWLSVTPATRGLVDLV